MHGLDRSKGRRTTLNSAPTNNLRGILGQVSFVFSVVIRQDGKRNRYFHACKHLPHGAPCDRDPRRGHLGSLAEKTETELATFAEGREEIESLMTSVRETLDQVKTLTGQVEKTASKSQALEEKLKELETKATSFVEQVNGSEGKEGWLGAMEGANKQMKESADSFAAHRKDLKPTANTISGLAQGPLSPPLRGCTCKITGPNAPKHRWGPKAPPMTNTGTRKQVAFERAAQGKDTVIDQCARAHTTMLVAPTPAAPMARTRSQYILPGTRPLTSVRRRVVEAAVHQAPSPSGPVAFTSTW